MPVSNNDKFAIIDELQKTRTKANRLVISLLFARKKTEADEVRKKVKRLDAQIDGLLAQSMKAWSGSGKAIIEKMKNANKLLQRDINDIKKKKDLANKVVKALGRLDEAILKAKDLLTKI